MDSQIENAIEIAYSPSSDPTLKLQAIEFISNARADASAYESCLQLATRIPKASDVVRSTCLDIINSAINDGRLDVASLSFVKDSILAYTRQTYSSAGSSVSQDSRNVQNKIAQTITYLFVYLYAQEWLTFFDDFIGLTIVDGNNVKANLPGVVLFLRLLGSIHDEIADVLIFREGSASKRAADLKDFIRDRDAPKVIATVYEIFSYWRDQSDEAVQLCLRVIGSWVSWVDISLILDEKLMELLFTIIGRTPVESQDGNEDQTRDAAIGTLTEIITKKMPPQDKLDLIQYLNVGGIVSRLVSIPALNDLQRSATYDHELAETTARLTNAAAEEVVRTLDSGKLDTDKEDSGRGILVAFMPHLLRFFSDEFDEVSLTVVPALTDVLTFFRKELQRQGSLRAQYSTLLPSILHAATEKLRYDESYEWGDQLTGTDEAEFEELRKRVHVVQNSIAAIDKELYCQTIAELVSGIFAKYRNSPSMVSWRELELALDQMFAMSEALGQKGGLFSKEKPIGEAGMMVNMLMTQLLDLDIASHPHPCIQLNYMEMCVRYIQFLEIEQQHIPKTLGYFLRIIHTDHPRVRTRSWYLFLKFVKQLRNQLGDLAIKVVDHISDLLVIHAEDPENKDEMDDSSTEDGDQSGDATAKGQLYLFEAVGCLSSSPANSAEKQAAYARSIMVPLLLDLEKQISLGKHTGRSIMQAHYTVMSLGALARGYSDWMPGVSSTAHRAPAVDVANEFERAAEAILVTLEQMNNEQVREAARSAFSRLIGVLGPRILSSLPRWISGLLSSDSSMEDISTFLKLLDQLLFGFKTEISGILDSLLAPLLERVYASLATEPSGTDTLIELGDLRREYLNFILAILNNDLGAVLVGPTNQHKFEEVLSTISDYARSPLDLPTAKLAFTTLTKMCNVWGGPDVITPSEVTSKKATTNNTPIASELPGFHTYMIENLSPLCWALPSDPRFRGDDAQARLALGEIASLMKTLYAKTGDQYLLHLQTVIFPGLGSEQGSVDDFINALKNLDTRKFRQFVSKFVQRQ